SAHASHQRSQSGSSDEWVQFPGKVPHECRSRSCRWSRGLHRPAGNEFPRGSQERLCECKCKALEHPLYPGSFPVAACGRQSRPRTVPPRTRTCPCPELPPCCVGPRLWPPPILNRCSFSSSSKVV